MGQLYIYFMLDSNFETCQIMLLISWQPVIIFCSLFSYRQPVVNKNILTSVLTLCSADSYPSSVAFYVTVNLLHRSDREVMRIFYLKSYICRNIALKTESKPSVLRTTLRYIHNTHECMSSLFSSRLYYFFKDAWHADVRLIRGT
jgi:hypothetical protein